MDLFRIRHDLDEGQRTLSGLDFHTVDQRGGIVPVASAAGADLHRAAHLASSSPWLSLLSDVPIVGEQFDALRDMTGAADRIGQLGVTTARDVQAALDQASDQGPSGRVALIDHVNGAVDQLQAGLRAVDVGARGSLLPPLRTARSKLVHHLDDAATRLDDAHATLRVLRAFLLGPRRYLILGGNNAEMRSVGIATTSGLATVHDGAVDVGDFVDPDATRLTRPGVPLPDGWQWLFGYLDPDIEYGNTVCSPNFPLTGQTAAAIAARNRHGPVDGVMYVDTVSLQVLLTVVGPVTVDGVTYDGTNAARELINENYLRFTTANERTQRHDAQGRVAKAIFDAINTRHVSLIKLASRLQDLAKSRHLEAWSSDPDEEKLWHDVGADGSRSPNDVMIASEDLGASKLDFYVTENVAMKVTPEGDNRRVAMSISLTNPRRDKSSPVIDGGSRYANPGEYGFYLVVYLPRDATDVVHDDPSWTSAAQDGPLQATTFTARAPEGTTRTIDVSFLLPNDHTTIDIVPSARVRPATWTVGRLHFDDRFPTTLDLTKVTLRTNPPTSLWLIVALGVFALGAALAGDAWGRAAVASASRAVSPRAQFDANVGWWLMAIGAATLAAQVAIYLRG